MVGTAFSVSFLFIFILIFTQSFGSLFFAADRVVLYCVCVLYLIWCLYVQCMSFVHILCNADLLGDK